MREAISSGLRTREPKIARIRSSGVFSLGVDRVCGEDIEVENEEEEYVFFGASSDLGEGCFLGGGGASELVELEGIFGLRYCVGV